MEGRTSKEGGFLSKPLVAGGRITWWTVVYVLIVIFIIFTRLWALSSRAYSHDESIHAWESWKLVTGQGYTHSPVYHGPFLYHFTAFIFALFGDNDFTARLSPVLFGITLTLLPLALKKWLGKEGVLAATLLMAISPVMMHRSRFLRHDPFVAVFNLLLFIAILRYLDEHKSRDLYLAAAAISLGLCAKETTFITYFIFGTFLAGLLLWQWLGDRSRPWNELPTDLPVFDLVVMMGMLILPTASPFLIRILGGDPVDYSQQGILFSGSVFLVVLAISVAVGLWWDWRRWLVCLGIFYGIFIPLFTTMFTNGKGFATGMVGQLGYWLSQQGVKRGGQPWFYYLVLMPLYEFLPLTAGVGGAVYYFLRGDPREQEEARTRGREAIPFVLFVIYWSFMAFALYSWAGEKMPWLTMHLALPLQLLAGWAIGRLFMADWQEIRAQKGLWLLIVLPLFLYALGRLLFVRPYTGVTLKDLNQTMSWLAALVVAILLGIALFMLLRRLRARERWRMVALALLLVLSLLTIRFAWMATFINADLATEFLVYAQGAPDVALVTRELEDMSRRLTGGLHMKVAYDDDSSWPFVWYLRNFDNAQFYGKKPSKPFDAEVVIVGPANEAAVKPLLGNRYYRRQYRLIWWPNQDWYMGMTLKNLWADLKDRTARKKMWDVIFYRKYDVSLTSWPYVHNFAMYVRRDVAQQLWDYGPEALAAAGPLPGDEYMEKWKQVQASFVFGSGGNAPGQFRAPKGLALDAEGNIYIADSQNHRIQVFDAQGRFLRQWGREGTAPGQFKEPWGVAVAPNGDVYVADTWNHRIQVFDAQGNFKRMWGVFGEVQQPTGPGNVFYGPRDLIFDQEGYLYVADTGNKRIIKYDARSGQSEQMVGAVGGAGTEDGRMQEPVGIALDGEGNLYVADTWNQRIQVFDKGLHFLRKWQVYAWEGMSVVNKPYLAVDAAGNVYATDPEGYRILKFDSTGKLLSIWGQYGSDLASMNLPTGIKVDPQGRILVTDSENNRVLIFMGQ
ncbi:MAG: TIGR03663 family protein [Anaerolineae bacterium]|nr:TIGR03663 family protein [Anaerolineae bacterium]